MESHAVASEHICVNAVTSLDMQFNASKSVSMIYAPYNVNKRVQFLYPNFKLGDDLISTVNNVKYLGHLIATDNDDRDITRQMSLLYARTNFLIRKFAKCSTDVKKCLFRAYCINFYGIALWDNYHVAVINKFEAAYVKCIKMFFGYGRRDSATGMFFTLCLPTFNTIIHNAKLKFDLSLKGHENLLVKMVHAVCGNVSV